MTETSFTITDAALLQLRDAIRLFFASYPEYSPSASTLAHAADTVLFDLCKKEGKTQLFQIRSKEYAKTFLKDPDNHKDVISAANSTPNKLKHANKSGITKESIIEAKTDEIAARLITAVLSHELIGGKTNKFPELVIFIIWASKRWPDLFSSEFLIASKKEEEHILGHLHSEEEFIAWAKEAVYQLGQL